MKPIKKAVHSAVLMALLIAGLASCSNLLTKDISEARRSTNAAGTGTGSISGSFTIDGALPSELARSITQSSARTAFPSTEFTGCEFKISAMNGTTAVKAVTVSLNDDDFLLTGLTINTTYHIRVQLVTRGTGIVFLEGNSADFTLTATNYQITLSDPITLAPTQSGKGDIYLVVSQNSDCVDMVDRVVATLEKKSGETFTETGSFDFDSGDAVIEFYDISSGYRKLTLQFYKDIDDNTSVLVYKCIESVNIFDNMMTEWWVKNGDEPYLTYRSNQIQFVLTSEILSAFAKNTYYVDTSASSSTESGTVFNPFKSLQKAVQAANNTPVNGAKTIYVKGSASDIFNTAIELSKNLTIETYSSTPGDYETAGKPTHEVTVNSGYQFAVAEGVSLSVKGIIFNTPESGYTYPDQSESYGGYFTFNSGSTGSFTGCTFKNGKSNNGAGAFFLKTAEITLDSCYFENNKVGTNPYDIQGTSNSSIIVTGETWIKPEGKVLLFSSSKIEASSLSLPAGANGICSIVYVVSAQAGQQRVIGPEYFNVTFESTSGDDEIFLADNGTFGYVKYVDPTGDDDVNNGTASAPWETLDHALTYIKIASGTDPYLIKLAGNNTYLVQQQYTFIGKVIHIQSADNTQQATLKTNTVESFTLKNASLIVLKDIKLASDFAPEFYLYDSSVSLSGTITPPETSTYRDTNPALFYLNNSTISIKNDFASANSNKMRFSVTEQPLNGQALFEGLKASEWQTYFQDVTSNGTVQGLSLQNDGVFKSITPNVFYVGGSEQSDEPGYGFSNLYSFYSLSYAISQCPDNEAYTIKLCNDMEWTASDTELFTDGIIRNKDITISTDTTGTSRKISFLDGQNMHFVSSGITFDGIEFERGDELTVEANGGYVCSENTTLDLCLINCTFNKSEVDSGYHGGAIYLDSNSYIFIQNCTWAQDLTNNYRDTTIFFTSAVWLSGWNIKPCFDVYGVCVMTFTPAIYSDMPPTERTDNDGPISIFVNQSKMCFQDNANKYSNEDLIVYNYSGESIDASEIRLY